MSDYVLDNARPQAATRMGLLERLFDGYALPILAQAVRPGARCWEVGAGGGSIAHLMHELGAAEVWATDVDTRYVRAPQPVHVLTHDVVADPAPAHGLDFVHMRLVASHLGRKAFVGTVLPKLVDALRPGGALLVEELDPMGPYAPSLEASLAQVSDVNTVGEAFTQVLASKGGFPWLGRDLRQHFEAAGLEQVAAQGHVRTHRGGEPAAALMIANIEQVRAELHAKPQHVEATLAALRDPAFTWQMPTFWQALGVKPS